MSVFCTEKFKSEYKSLIKKKSYSSLTSLLYNFFFTYQDIEEIKSGTRLNGHAQSPLIKKRLAGSGGFRVYYYLLVVEEDIFLMYVHPKTGKRGADNVSREAIAKLYKDILNHINDKNLYEMLWVDKNGRFTFKHLQD